MTWTFKFCTVSATYILREQWYVQKGICTFFMNMIGKRMEILLLNLKKELLCVHGYDVNFILGVKHVKWKYQTYAARIHSKSLLPPTNFAHPANIGMSYLYS